MSETTLTTPSPPRAGAEATARSLLATALRRARWTIFWERLWPAVAALATVIGLFLAASWLGLWLWLPPLGRAIGLAAFVAAAIAAAIPFVLLRMPGMIDGLRRLDRASGLRHRPATAIADELAVRSEDPYSLALWNAHVQRALVTARTLKAGQPSPRVARRDPYALRALVLVACVATFFAAGGERWKRVAAAFDWHGVVLPANFRVDAWVIPPPYTAKPPIILPGMHPGETYAQLSAPVTVPVNSTLVVRSTGAVNLDVSASGGVAPAKDQVRAPAGTEEHRFTVTAEGGASLRGVGNDVTWSFIVVPDKPPTIALTKDPEQQGRGSLLLSYRLEDDYGVTEAKATFARKDDPAAAGAEGPHPLFGPPDFSLILPQARTRKGAAQTIKDLTDHPWAGADVVMTLIARDDGGNEGHSEPFAFRLPERMFVKPLARALVEQRRNLALDARSRPRVLTALDALALAPEKFTTDTGVYLGLRTIYWSLARAQTDDDLRNVVAQLWSMALQIEDGDIADAQAALRNAEEALRQALERGASDQEIKQLMDQLRAAMDRFMQAMIEQLRRNQQLSRPLDHNSRTLSQRDLKSMLDRLEDLARHGSREAARQLLQQFQQMMENLDAFAGTQGTNGDEADDAVTQDLEELGDIIRGQQDLRDRTFRQGQDQRRNGQRGPQGQNRPGQQGNAMGDLQHNQQALHDRLKKLLDDLRSRGFGQSQHGQGQGQGQEEMGELGSAGEAMGQAEGELGQGDADSAVGSQGRALDALRKGLHGLAQALQQQQMGQGPGPGRVPRLAQPRADQETDPLGRPLPRHGVDPDDFTVRVPGEIDVQRARRIIEELRRRFGDFARPQEELDYIQRLLQGY